MSVTVNATFTLSQEDFKNLMPMTNVVVEYSDKEEKLKLFLIALYLHVHKHKVDKLICNELWLCINSNDIIHHCIKFLQSVDCKVVSQYIINKISENVYASILEEDDFYNKLINLIIEDDVEKLKPDEMDDIVNTYKSAPSLMDLVSDDTFETLLSKIGINEEGKIKARNIKAEMKDGKPDMNKVMAFISEYKQNFDSSNIDLNTIYKTFSGLGDETKSPQLPFDLNNIMNMMNSFTTPKSRRGRRR